MWVQLTKQSTDFLSLFSMFLFSSSLSFVPTLSFDPKKKERKKERKGSLFLFFSFSPQAAEKESEDITDQMSPCGGALMKKLDEIPCYGTQGLQFSQQLYFNTQDISHEQM